jgi:O-glycosyl hydrolase
MSLWQNKLGSLVYTAQEERDFVKNFLGPSLKKDLEKKLTVWDHNRDLLTQRASTILMIQRLSMFGVLDFIGMKVGVEVNV